MKVGITGSDGFIGSALARQFPGYSRYPRKDLDILFHFGSPSSEIIFKEDRAHAFRETINSFIDAVEFCSTNNIKLIYPSSATVYNKVTSYGRCKSCLEEIHQAYGGNILGLRIFAGYGVGEEHKEGYSSIVYDFCRRMKAGEQPVIWGDGTQTRDFIYIDDIVDTIMKNLRADGIIDVGTGVNTSFRDIVAIINNELGTTLEPGYLPRPEQYVSETPCTLPITGFIPIQEGVRRICQTL